MADETVPETLVEPEVQPEVPKRKIPQANWEYRPLKMVGYMKTICTITVEASTQELASLRRKLEKLRYGA